MKWVETCPPTQGRRYEFEGGGVNALEWGGGQYIKNTNISEGRDAWPPSSYGGAAPARPCSYQQKIKHF